jgi:hypothetical protein
MCIKPKCWRASVMLMQDAEAFDGVAIIKINAQNIATLMGSPLTKKHKHR